ncbi:potassium-transporting ATPase subunit F [Methylococcus sp. EFPC2]|uniref:potassium-transporting ATPase subunit F n=1 Tax=Methylococcus sp. EFPC2 TaxID=2812648 RepID=UPI001966FBC5|nr:potassium-transporting ATPase subunit F [Methylococcus sp. EFPC2]QSA97162.1 potassium-transporting ATPase subunit F [Methylococcus sp. EFPC2]
MPCLENPAFPTEIVRFQAAFRVGGFPLNVGFVGDGESEDAIVSWIDLVSAGLALVVFVYLVVALFYPEKY